MSLSDCPKCWDTPCICGHEYTGWTIERLKKLIAVLQGVIKDKEYLGD